MKTGIAFIFFLAVFSMQIHAQQLSGSEIPGTEKPVLAKTDNRYIHYGIIPYQFLARSSAIYGQYDLNYHLSVEANLGFTYKQKFVDDNYGYWLGTHGYWYYQGSSNSLAFSCSAGRMSFSTLFVQRYWWFNKEVMPVDGISTASSYSYSVLKSSRLFAYGFGMRIAVALGRMDGSSDSEFFSSFMLLSCQENTSILENVGNRAPPPGYMSLPQSENSRFLMPSIAIGFRFGFKHLLRKTEKAPEKTMP